METIINFISEYYPVIGLVLALLAVAVVVTFKIAMYHASIQNTRKKVDELPCDTHAKILEAIPCDLHTKILDLHNQKIDEVKVNVAEMKGIQIASYGNPLSRKKSPESLTEEGEKLVSDYNLEVMVNDNWSKIKASINALGTKNPYDIQEFCRKTAYLDTDNVDNTKFLK